MKILIEVEVTPLDDHDFRATPVEVGVHVTRVAGEALLSEAVRNEMAPKGWMVWEVKLVEETRD